MWATISLNLSYLFLPIFWSNLKQTVQCTINLYIILHFNIVLPSVLSLTTTFIDKLYNSRLPDNRLSNLCQKKYSVMTCALCWLKFTQLCWSRSGGTKAFQRLLGVCVTFQYNSIQACSQAVAVGICGLTLYIFDNGSHLSPLVFSLSCLLFTPSCLPEHS